MSVLTPLRLTVAEYLEWEETNEVKHEYIDGELRSMTGANRNHNRIMTNVTIAIGRQLDNSNCSLLSSQMKVKVGETRYLYPDLSAVCGEETFERENEMVLLNPVLVIEVTSPSSIEFDRGEKRDFYFDVPAIQEYLVIDQHRVYVERNTRSESGWQVQVYADLEDVIPLEALNCTLPLDQVYRGISFESQRS